MDREAYWVPSQKQGWTLAALVGSSDKQVTVRFADGTTSQFDKGVVLPFKEEHRMDIDDMITMSEAHEAPLLFNLKRRYDKDKVYTNIGPVVISVNPFKELDLDSTEVINQFLTEHPSSLPPHLFSVALNAYRSLVNQNLSQSVIISGESGAGKTEATKMMLKFLTKASGSNGDLSSRILATNPVLESFGNAKTVRNNNSSRFGKFISITFDPGGTIKGAKIENYLLETTRVVSQAPTERNYHVFYQLLAGMPPEKKISKYCLTSDKYNYLQNGFAEIPGIDDKESFLELVQSLTTLGINEIDQEQLFSVVAAILLLGNIEFVGSDQVKVKDYNALRNLCTVLQVSTEQMTVALTQRLFTGGGRKTAYEIPLNSAQAIENRDALAKAMYTRLFDYIIDRLNTQLEDNSQASQKSNTFKSIGVLDIYGFEVFQHNSLEQFCINYANEKLHQLFNEHVFKAEQAMYLKDGVPWDNIQFVDNQDCIELIEGKVGVLSMLDEECRIPKGDDAQLLLKLVQKHGKNSKFGFSHKTPMEFQMRHYAGLVSYEITGFLTKNRDTFNRDIVASLWDSGLRVLHELFTEEFQEEERQMASARNGRGRGRGRPQNSTRPNGRVSISAMAEKKKLTVCKRFNQSLLELVQSLTESQRHYVRCIKPNDTSSPNVFDMKKVLVQLQNNGVLETIRMRKSGFASHTVFDSFFQRFCGLGIRENSSQVFSEFLMEIGGDPALFAIGNTKVFLKSALSEKLENSRRELYFGSITVMQKHIRRFLAEKKLIQLREQHIAKVNLATIKIQSIIRRWYAKGKLRVLVEEEKKRREEERRRREEEERKRKEEEERRRKEEEERKRKEEEERRKREEELRKEEERKKREEDERKRREEEDRRKRDDDKRKEEDRKRRDEEEKRKDDERKFREEEDRRKREEQKRIREEELKKEEERKQAQIKYIEENNHDQTEDDAYYDQDEVPQNPVFVERDYNKAATTLQCHIRIWYARRHVIMLVVETISNLRKQREDQAKNVAQVIQKANQDEEDARLRLMAKRRERVSARMLIQRDQTSREVIRAIQEANQQSLHSQPAQPQTQPTPQTQPHTQTQAQAQAQAQAQGQPKRVGPFGLSIMKSTTNQPQTQPQQKQNSSSKNTDDNEDTTNGSSINTSDPEPTTDNNIAATDKTNDTKGTLSEEEEDDEDENEEVKLAEFKKRQAQRELREAERKTARRSLLLASLVTPIEPQLAEEIMEKDVKPNLNVTTTLTRGTNNLGPGLVQRKNPTSGTASRRDKVNPVFAKKRLTANLSQNNANSPQANATYTVQYASPPPTFMVEVGNGNSNVNNNANSTSTSQPSTPKKATIASTRQRSAGPMSPNVTNSANGNADTIPKSPLSQSYTPRLNDKIDSARNDTDDEDDEVPEFGNKKTPKSTKSKITRAFQPFWNKKPEKESNPNNTIRGKAQPPVPSVTTTSYSPPSSPSSQVSQPATTTATTAATTTTTTSFHSLSSYRAPGIEKSQSQRVYTGSPVAPHRLNKSPTTPAVTSPNSSGMPPPSASAPTISSTSAGNVRNNVASPRSGAATTTTTTATITTPTAPTRPSTQSPSSRVNPNTPGPTVSSQRNRPQQQQQPPSAQNTTKTNVVTTPANNNADQYRPRTRSRSVPDLLATRREAHQAAVQIQQRQQQPKHSDDTVRKDGSTRGFSIFRTQKVKS